MLPPSTLFDSRDVVAYKVLLMLFFGLIEGAFGVSGFRKAIYKEKSAFLSVTELRMTWGNSLNK